jgi:hypothetical protein
MRWPQLIVIARRTSITIIRQTLRQNRKQLSPRRPMTPSVPWIAARRDISGAAPQSQQTLLFPHRQ